MFGDGCGRTVAPAIFSRPPTAPARPEKSEASPAGVAPCGTGTDGAPGRAATRIESLSDARPDHTISSCLPFNRQATNMTTLATVTTILNTRANGRKPTEFNSACSTAATSQPIASSMIALDRYLADRPMKYPNMPAHAMCPDTPCKVRGISRSKAASQARGSFDDCVMV